MPGGAYEGDTALLLCLSKRRRNFCKHRKVLVDVRFRVLHRDGPLLVPPVRLREHAAIYHRKPVMAPQIDINGRPVTVVANFLRVQHQRAIYSGADYVGLQPNFSHSFAIAVGEFLTELADVRIILASQHFAKSSQPGSHRNAVGVVGAAMKNFVLRNQIHDRAAGAKRAKWRATADGFGQADHVRLNTKKLRGTAPG